MRSFLPNHLLMNAARCCANPDCDKKEAEAEAGAEAEPLPLKIMCPECCMAHYCNDGCQKADWEHHQHQCNKDAQKMKEEIERVLKLNHTKENTDNDDDKDNELFQSIPPKDDCPICTLPLPLDETRSTYYSCCGKVICKGCYDENLWVTFEPGTQRELILPCPFCRAPPPLTDDENFTRIKKRMEVNDSKAILMASEDYKDGEYGLPKDPKKAFELCLRAAELGSSNACNNLAVYYEDGVVVTKDMTKAREYYEMAVKKGNIWARHNLGAVECEKGNHHTAGRHYLISAAAGHADSLEEIAKFYKFQLVTKEEYSTALTSYSNVHKNAYSIERERSAAVSNIIKEQM